MSDHNKFDALFHKTHIKVLLVPRLNMCRSILSLKWHIKCVVITHSAKETGKQKEQWGVRVGGDGEVELEGGGGQNLKKKGCRQYKRVFIKYGG